MARFRFDAEADDDFEGDGLDGPVPVATIVRGARVKVRRAGPKESVLLEFFEGYFEARGEELIR